LSSHHLSQNIRIKIHKSIILPVALYGCGTWSKTLREERRLRVFGNSVLKRIFGLKRGEIVGGWRKLLTEECHNVYFLSNVITMISQGEWDGQGL
jgi:hypothetical protein